MTTWGDVINEVRASLSGYGLEQDNVTWLTMSCTDTDLTLTVADTSSVRAGVIEIDDEVMRVASVNPSTATITIVPGGRGWRGTVATAHTASTFVTFNPRFTRTRIRRALASTVSGLWPDVWYQKKYTFTWSPAQIAYPMPVDTEKVTSVQWRTLVSTQEWIPVRKWRFEHEADATAFTTGRSLTIYDPIQPGATVQVVYMLPFAVPANDVSPIQTGGMTEDMIDLLTAGASWRLISPLDAAGVSPQGASADLLDQARPSGSAAAASRALQQAFKELLADQQRSLQTSLPTRVHRTLR